MLGRLGCGRFGEKRWPKYSFVQHTFCHQSGLCACMLRTRAKVEDGVVVKKECRLQKREEQETQPRTARQKNKLNGDAQHLTCDFSHFELLHFSALCHRKFIDKEYFFRNFEVSHLKNKIVLIIGRSQYHDKRLESIELITLSLQKSRTCFSVKGRFGSRSLTQVHTSSPNRSSG